MTFGEKVKNERNRLGLNQDELAKKIGVTRRVISSYENDSSRPRGTCLLYTSPSPRDRG